MNFYGLTDNTIDSRGWAYAVSVIPKSELVDINCTKCGTRSSYPSAEFDVIVEGGSKYPDILQCGAYPFLIVSEAVVNDWEANGITSYKKYKVNVAGVNYSKLKEVIPPQYYHITVNGRCDIDLKKMGITITKHCECGKIEFEPVIGFGFVIKSESWDGSDLFVSELFPRVYFCTEKILHLAGKNKRTNFLFQLPEDLDNWGVKGIDYIKVAKTMK